MHLKSGDAHTAGLNCPAVQAEAAAEGEMVEYMSSEEMKRYRLQELERERQDKVGARMGVTHIEPASCGPIPAASEHQPQVSDGEHQDKVGWRWVSLDPWLAFLISMCHQVLAGWTQPHRPGTSCCLDRER